MSRLVVEDAVAALNDIVSADGAKILLIDATETVVELDLDLSESSCPECVVPRNLLIEIISARLAQSAPDVTTIRLNDPRTGPAADH